ncbi:MAG TPA: hypothetical protein VK582_09095 [Pyrinomonadaceae bacterium]|nr:hypothetical protein [Pyrinomonadaceae bacterium]
MSGPQPTKYLIATTNRWRLWLTDTFGHFLEPAVIFVLGAAFSVGFLVFEHAAEAVVVFIHATVSAGIVFLITRAHRQDTILLEVTMSYLIQGEKPLLDHLLGRLIGGRWNRNELKPGSALFDVLEKIAKSDSPQSWETKRRIAEALPALGETNAARTFQIVQILRADWDPVRYKSDLRRRAVEALTTPLRKGHSPLIDRLTSEQVASVLQTQDGDQVFTAFAIAEALNSWNQSDSEVGLSLRKYLSAFAKQKYTENESQAVDELIRFLSQANRGDAFRIEKELREMAANPNDFVRIAAARNLLLISDQLVDDTLDLMRILSDRNQSKYVRRPIAKERSVRFLIQMLDQSRTKDQAKELILRLASDPDQIIRVTTLDMSDALLRSDAAFLETICDRVLTTEKAQQEPSLELIERVTRTLLELAA